MPSYTLDSLLGSPELIGFVIDRSEQTRNDKTIWRDYLRPELTTQREFKSLYGATTAVRMASVIDDLSQKPLRNRRALGEAILEVIPMGNKFQLSLDRLQKLQDLLALANVGKIESAQIVDFLIDDFRELTLAPEKRLDKMLGDLLFKGEAEITAADNPDGTLVPVMEIPIHKEVITDKLTERLYQLRQDYGHLGLGVIEMSRATFVKHFASNELLRTQVTKQLGDRKVSFGTTILSEVELNAYFEMLGLPKVRLIDARVTKLDGTHEDVAPLDHILLRPDGAIGKLRYHNPLEINDPVPTKTYVQRPNGLFVSTMRTDEGRFVEFGCEWVPEITMPEHLVSVDISGLDTSTSLIGKTPKSGKVSKQDENTDIRPGYNL